MLKTLLDEEELLGEEKNLLIFSLITNGYTIHNTHLYLVMIKGEKKLIIMIKSIFKMKFNILKCYRLTFK